MRTESTKNIIRLPEVMRRTGLSRSSIYLRVSKGTMPKHISLGGRAVGWLKSEINFWLEQQITASKANSKHKWGSNE